MLWDIIWDKYVADDITDYQRWRPRHPVQGVGDDYTRWQAWYDGAYGQVHQQAQAVQRRRRYAWLPDDILDLEELVMLSNSSLRHRAKKVFKSLAPNPHTKVLNISMVSADMEGIDVPRDAMTNMLMRLLQRGKSLTRRQKEAVEAYDEAIHAEKPPIMYVAKKLGIHKSNASELLKRAKIGTFGKNVPVYSSGRMPDKELSRDAVRQKMATRKRICAYCGQRRAPGDKQLCHDCYRFSIDNPETWDELTHVVRDGDTVPWFQQEANRIYREHYRWAAEALLFERYGTVSEIEYERLVNAA